MKKLGNPDLLPVTSFNDVDIAQKFYNNVDPAEYRIIVRFDLRDNMSNLVGKYSNTWEEWEQCPREGTPGSPITMQWTGDDLTKRLFEFASNGIYLPQELTSRYAQFNINYPGKNILDVYQPMIVISRRDILEDHGVCYTPRDRDILGLFKLSNDKTSTGYFYKKRVNSNDLTFQSFVMGEKIDDSEKNFMNCQITKDLSSLILLGFQEGIYSPNRRVGIRAVKTKETVEVYDWLEEYKNVPLRST